MRNHNPADFIFEKTDSDSRILYSQGQIVLGFHEISLFWQRSLKLPSIHVGPELENCSTLFFHFQAVDLFSSLFQRFLLLFGLFYQLCLTKFDKNASPAWLQLPRFVFGPVLNRAALTLFLAPIPCPSDRISPGFAHETSRIAIDYYKPLSFICINIVVNMVGNYNPSITVRRTMQ